MSNEKVNKAFNLFKVIGKLEVGENLIYDEVRHSKAVVIVNADKDQALLIDFVETDEEGVSVVLDYSKRYIIVL